MLPAKVVKVSHKKPHGVLLPTVESTNHRWHTKTRRCAILGFTILGYRDNKELENTDVTELSSKGQGRDKWLCTWNWHDFQEKWSTWSKSEYPFFSVNLPRMQEKHFTTLLLLSKLANYGILCTLSCDVTVPTQLKVLLGRFVRQFPDQLPTQGEKMCSCNEPTQSVRTSPVALTWTSGRVYPF